MLNILHRRGFSLVEMLIALAINGIIIAGVIALFSSNMRHYQLTRQSDKFNQQLQTALDIISSEIRRAGFWGDSATAVGSHANNNPFMAANVDLTINAAKNCIIFSYDKNADKMLPGASASIDDERYGFRVLNQVLQARPPGATLACDTAFANWENITNSNEVVITNLTFTLNTSSLATGSGTSALLMRSVDISITGAPANDPSNTKTLTQHVVVRNDKYIP